jgi:hypothetical protein
MKERKRSDMSEERLGDPEHIEPDDGAATSSPLPATFNGTGGSYTVSGADAPSLPRKKEETGATLPSGSGAIWLSDERVP